jgi:hypothetical protein
MTHDFSHVDYDESQFSVKERREIERQIDGRPRRVKRLSTLHRSALDQVTHELAVVAHTTLGRRAFDAVRFDLITEFSCSNLEELSQQLRCGPEGECYSLGLFWLLSVAHERREFALCAAVALRPAFERIVTLSDPSGRDEDLVCDLLAAFYGSLPITTHNTREYLIHLHNEVRSEVRRRKALTKRDSVVDTQIDPETPERREVPTFDLRTVIAEVVRQGLLTNDEIELVVRTQVDGEKLHDLAVERNILYKTLQSQRRRAELVLRGFLSREGVVL